MNFLNKKHVQTFANTTSHFTPHQSATKPFINPNEQIPQHSQTGTYIGNRVQQNKASRIKQSPKPPSHFNPPNIRIKDNQQPQYASTYSQNFPNKKSQSTSNMSIQNLCSQHQNQVLRHLCLQCNQLLCSECISDHLEGHRQTTKTIPKIQTINKLKKQMNLKAQKILQFMQENNPKVILNDISQLKFDAISRIQQMKNEVIKAFQQWCKVLQNHVIQDMIKVDQLQSLSLQMGKIKQQVLNLYNDMSGSQSAPVQTVKKIHQIDSQKLQAAYLQMFNTFSKTVLKSKFAFDYNWKYLMQSFEKSIILRPLHVPKNIYEHEQKPQNYIQRKSSKQISNFENIIVKNNQHEQQERKFMQIQSIESLIEPIGHLPGQRIIIPSNKTQIQQSSVQNQKVQRSFSRQGSGKRLAIFSTQDQRNVLQQSPIIQ